MKTRVPTLVGVLLLAAAGFVVMAGVGAQAQYTWFMWTAVFIVLAFVMVAARTVLAVAAEGARQIRWWNWVWLLMLLSSLVFRLRTSEEIHASELDIWRSTAWRS